MGKHTMKDVPVVFDLFDQSGMMKATGNGSAYAGAELFPDLIKTGLTNSS